MIHLQTPNLDAETIDPNELTDFAVNLTRLALYAELKAQAMRFRRAGKIVEAQRHERRCDMVFDLLPPSWRW
jgi:hypothetical protein